LATTKTLSPNGSGTNTVTMPAGSEKVQISVLNTDFSNITDAINNNYTAIATKATSHGPGEFSSIKANGVDSTADTIVFGGGDDQWASGNIGGIMYTHGNRQYVFRAKGSTNGKNEDYSLPVHSDGSSNQSYNILTTKDYSGTLGRITTFAGTSSNKTFSFELPQGYHAMVCIAAGFACFFNGSGILYNTELPSGFTAAISGTTVTITRSNTTAFVVHGIVISN